MFSFSSKEKQELVIGTLIFVLVGLSMVIDPLNFLLDFNLNLALFLLILACFLPPLWLFHELAHKFASQYYGLHSEFRLYPNYAIISLMTIFIPFKIIAPGVVLYGGSFRSDIPARTALAGPLTNIFLGGAFLAFTAISNTYWASLLRYVSYLSFNLALFNLLPFSVLDGAKIFKWNTYIYTIVFSLTLILFLFHPLGILGSII